MTKDLRTPSFFIIAALGTIVTAGFFLAFSPALFRRQLDYKPKKYALIVFDVYGNKTTLTGIRTNFRNKQVAYSFAKFYKKEFPLHTFQIVNDLKNDKQLIENHS